MTMKFSLVAIANKLVSLALRLQYHARYQECACADRATERLYDRAAAAAAIALTARVQANELLLAADASARASGKLWEELRKS